MACEGQKKKFNWGTTNYVDYLRDWETADLSILGMERSNIEEDEGIIVDESDLKDEDFKDWEQRKVEEIIEDSYIEPVMGLPIVNEETIENSNETKEINMENIEEVGVETKDISQKNLKSFSADGKIMDGIDWSILFLKSAQWAFLICIIGVIAQAFQLYHVFGNISDLTGFGRTVNSAMLAWFFSVGLLYFSLKMGRVREDDLVRMKKYRRTVSWLVALDVFANLYYWSFKFMLIPAVLEKYMVDIIRNGQVVDRSVTDWGKVNWMTFDIQRVEWPQMIAAVVFAFALPFLLKAFAGEIRLPRFLDYRFRHYERPKDTFVD